MVSSQLDLRGPQTDPNDGWDTHRDCVGSHAKRSEGVLSPAIEESVSRNTARLRVTGGDTEVRESARHADWEGRCIERSITELPVVT